MATAGSKNYSPFIWLRSANSSASSSTRSSRSSLVALLLVLLPSCTSAGSNTQLDGSGMDATVGDSTMATETGGDIDTAALDDAPSCGDLGAPCSTSTDCCGGHLCDAGFCACLGAGAELANVRALSDCAGVCCSDTCSRPPSDPTAAICDRSAVGGLCTVDTDCGSGVCVGGRCGPYACVTGRGDCNHDTTDGCEAELSTTTDCGACGHICPTMTVANGATACVSGTCDIACDAGWGNCDADAGDGCEADLSAPTSCGACGRACSGCRGGSCCTPDGYGCIGPEDTIPCCSGRCVAGSCGGMTTCSSAGAGCSVAADCCSGVCNSGRCCGHVGDHCSADSDCCFVGDVCYANRCCVYFGAACRGNTDCCSGVCVGGACAS